MTTEELQKLEELERRATLGPWHVGDGAAYGFDGSFDVHGPDNCGIAGMVGTAQAAKHQRNSEANAEFIAATRNALPELIAEIRRLRDWKR